jgi:hypothetical protein
MTPPIHVGAVLIEEWPLMTELQDLESEPYSDNWRLVKPLNGFALDRQIREAGWNFFFMAAELKVTFFGALGTEKIHSALEQILAKARHQNFNSLEVTGIAARHFLGIPYSTVSAHPRHIQQSCYLDSTRQREILQRNGEHPKPEPSWRPTTL